MPCFYSFLLLELMQQNYTHAVLPKKSLEDGCSDPREARVVVIFRDGVQKMLKEDSGMPICDLRPPPPLKAQPFGNCVEGLVEGKLYTREEMIRNGYHLCVHCLGRVMLVWTIEYKPHIIEFYPQDATRCEWIYEARMRSH
jgi:hypothetical protein